MKRSPGASKGQVTLSELGSGRACLPWGEGGGVQGGLTAPFAHRVACWNKLLGTPKNGAPWRLLGCLWLLLDGCCYFLVGSG